MWQQAIETAANCNPTYLELGRGVGGWLRYACVSKEAYTYGKRGLFTFGGQPRRLDCMPVCGV